MACPLFCPPFLPLNGQNKELVDELVALSMKYGLLTPYTSFLADERVQLHAMGENAQQARAVAPGPQ